MLSHMVQNYEGYVLVRGVLYFRSRMRIGSQNIAFGRVWPQQSHFEEATARTVAVCSGCCFWLSVYTPDRRRVCTLIGGRGVCVCEGAGAPRTI